MMNIVPDYQTPERMGAKLAAIPLPDFVGESVLDVGCDMGFWSFLAHDRGACSVLGLDRNRTVKGIGPTDLIRHNRQRAMHEGRACHFEQMELGRQWYGFGCYGIVLLFSLYHHIYEAAGGDHRPIWHWLWRHTAHDGELLWENPVDDSDPVVGADVSPAHRSGYTRAAILEAANEYFAAEFIGPALHEPTREVWRFTPKTRYPLTALATMQDGAGGAAKAFAYADNRRIGEIKRILGFRPVPGSLNLACAHPFTWDRHYYRAQVLDVAERGNGLAGEWSPRWARFYPARLNHVDCFAFRFEGESYPDDFVELIADRRLRDAVSAPLMLQW